MNWELNVLHDKDLSALQNALEGMWLDGQKAFPAWVVPLHDAIIGEWDRRENATMYADNEEQHP